MHPHPGNHYYAFDRSFPPHDAAASIHDEQDLQRAIDTYRFFYPTVSMEGMFNGGREAGIADGAGIMLLAAGPRHVVLTANSDTPYGSCVLDLAELGPVVIEMPPGPYIGLVDDHHHRWVTDLGIPGPDGGRGGKYLLVAPDTAEVVPAGYHVGRSDTNKVFLALRAMPQDGGFRGALDALRRVRVYPLARPKPLPFVDVTDRPIDATALRWEGNLEFWRRLHAVIDAEPPLEEFRPMYGALAALGVAKGRPFAPDARMRKILEEAAAAGLEQMRVEGFANQRPERLVWPDRQWEWLALVDNPNFESYGYLDLRARERFFVQAICTSPSMFRRAAGAGSVYFLTARDRAGAYLDGGSTYKLTVPHPVPARMFWSVTAYDALTRSQVQAAQNKAVLGSFGDAFERNADGSIDLYFGPRAPRGKDSQWIQTVPDRGYFLYFRIYGPDTAALDGSWRLADVAPIELRADRTTAPPHHLSKAEVLALSTPATVETRLGSFEFALGIPTSATVTGVHDALDHLHGVEAYLNTFQAAMFGATRRALLGAGVADHDVLLYSRLLDSRSLFLTGNCDTVYFFTILDLSAGPVVLEVPPGVLGTLDDTWSRWITDLGMAGPDRGEGGRYLIVPDGYAGPLPEGGYFVARARTHRAILLGRAFLEHDDPAPAVERIKHGLKIYPYTSGGYGASIAAFLAGDGAFVPPPPAVTPRFVEGTGLELDAIPPTDGTFFELLDEVVQSEPASALDPELGGQLAAIGIVKGKAFRPDARRKQVLAEAVATANAMARTLAFAPREEGAYYYGTGSMWTNPLFVGGYDFTRPPPLVTKDGVEPFPATGARALHARTSFFYLAFGITPAMCMRVPGIGSQYLGATRDAAGRPFDGARTYQITLPPNIPARMFWSLTLYDNQTRSMLATDQRYPRAGSQGYPTPAAVADANGATTIYLGPRRPPGVHDGNWIQTVPGQGWFVLLRLYSPLAAFFDKSWRPSEIEEMR